MTSAIQTVVGLFDKLKAAMDGPGEPQLDLCQKLMGQIKVAMLDFTSLPPTTVTSPSPTQQQELLLAREVLEQGAMLSIQTMEISAFERYVAQLKIYYSDCAATLPESARRFPILGLNLLRLLAQNRIAEFHTELELIPPELQASNVYIKYPAQLEQHIMEGSYNKVLSAKQDGLFSKEGIYFMDQLIDTVRDEIAECSAKAYTTISAADLQGLLMISSHAELLEFIEQRGWHIDGSTVSFASMDEEPTTQKLPSAQLIQQTLSYAKELERIV
mmetsp:Transcript_53190/g.105776  ORF Transcript_53190/g.105776 Transcript_53190/m.105776 type:complete len:273 (-) Transcript_53190:265-1083(-)